MSLLQDIASIEQADKVVVKNLIERQCLVHTWWKAAIFLVACFGDLRRDQML